MIAKKRKITDIYRKEINHEEIQKEELLKEREPEEIEQKSEEIEKEELFQEIEEPKEQEGKKNIFVAEGVFKKDLPQKDKFEETIINWEKEFKQKLEKDFPIDLKPKREQFQKSPSNRKKILIVASLIGAGVVFYFLSITSFARAEINIERKRLELPVAEQVLFDNASNNINVEKKVLPVNFYVFREKTEETFKSSGFGKDEKKATGKVTIFNNYSVYPQALVANTRLSTPDGKIFRINSRVVIPGATKENGNLVPGSIEVEVTADQPGPDYNIDPCNDKNNCHFSIVGFQGTDKYDKFYAYSYEKMAGGTYGTIPMVVEDDLKQAEDVILKKLVALIDEDVKNKIDKNLIVIEGARSGFKLTNLTADAKAGDTRETFNVAAEGQVIVAAFDENKVKDFLNQTYQSQLSDNQEICANKETGSPYNLKYKLEDIDFNNKTMKVKIEGNLYVCSKFSPTEIREMIKGKTVNEIQNLFTNYEGVEKIVLKMTPLWLKKAPQSLDKIKVSID